MGHAEFPKAVPEGHTARLQDRARLAALRDSDLMDTLPEEAFDRAVRLATHALGTPVGLLSLVDGRRQFFKAQIGLDGVAAKNRQTPLSHSFCQYVVSEDRVLSVADARNHELLAENGAVPDLGVVSYLGVPVHAPDGHTLGSFCAIDEKPHEWTEKETAVLEDLAGMIESELKLREEAKRRDLLVQELNHRVKNLFAMISGLVSLSSRLETSVPAMATSLKGRIYALAKAHELIRPAITGVKADIQNVSLQNLVASITEPHLTRDVDRLTIDGPSVHLGSTGATHLALILHEFATNAAKYGALSLDKGWLDVQWSIEGDNFDLLWKESGGPEIEEEPLASGFGSRLIDATIRNQLHGTLETQWNRTGVQHHLQAPLTRLVH